MIAELQTRRAGETEWQAVAAAVAGDPDARDRFCRRYVAVARRWLRARWHGSPLRAMVGDAVQEVFLECLRPGGALARYDPGRSAGFEPYLRGVVRNVAARVERREARHGARYEVRDAAMPGFAARQWGPAERVLADELVRVVRGALAELEHMPAVVGHSLAELAVLHFHEGLAVRHIAARWGVAPVRVHEQRRRLRILLRRRLSRELR